MGTSILLSGVRSIWLLIDCLKALSDKIAAEGPILTENQVVAAMERKKHDDEACGEIEAQHSGYCGSQDTYSRVAHAKLYATKPHITTADRPND